MSYQVHITSTAEHDIMPATDYIEFTLKNPDAAEHLLTCKLGHSFCDHQSKRDSRSRPCLLYSLFNFNFKKITQKTKLLNYHLASIIIQKFL